MDVRDIGTHVRAAADRDENFSIEKAIYIAILAIAQELL